MAIWSVLALMAAGSAQSQIGTGPEAGPPLVYNAEIDLSKAHSQSWALAQDAAGRLYVGNGEGLLAFDGAQWIYDAVDLERSGARGTTVRALAYGPEDRLFIGLIDAFGYVDQRESSAYVPLSDALPDSLRAFGDIWSMAVLPGAAYC